MAIDIKQTIADALFRLLDQKSVDKITVKELADVCGISRQGFYYHFRDIMEVVEWATAQSLQEAVEASLEAACPREALHTVIAALDRDKKLIRHLMNSQRRGEAERLLVQSARSYLEAMLRARAGELTVRTSDLEAAVRFHAYGLVGMLLEHLEGRGEAAALSDQLCRLLSGELWSQVNACFQTEACARGGRGEQDPPSPGESPRQSV